MNLLSGEDIGMEKHTGTTQFIRVEKGSGTAIVNGSKFMLKDGDAIIIPSGAKHNIIAGKNGLKIYSIYSPPEHNPKTQTKFKDNS